MLKETHDLLVDFIAVVAEKLASLDGTLINRTTVRVAAREVRDELVGSYVYAHIFSAIALEFARVSDIKAEREDTE